VALGKNNCARQISIYLTYLKTQTMFNYDDDRDDDRRRQSDTGGTPQRTDRGDEGTGNERNPGTQQPAQGNPGRQGGDLGKKGGKGGGRGDR
jgi:hypothetical protein